MIEWTSRQFAEWCEEREFYWNYPPPNRSSVDAKCTETVRHEVGRLVARIAELESTVTVATELKAIEQERRECEHPWHGYVDETTTVPCPSCGESP